MQKSCPPQSFLLKIDFWWNISDEILSERLHKWTCLNLFLTVLAELWQDAWCICISSLYWEDSCFEGYWPFKCWNCTKGVKKSAYCWQDCEEIIKWWCCISKKEKWETNKASKERWANVGEGSSEKPEGTAELRANLISRVSILPAMLLTCNVVGMLAVEN